jgi:YegS/Rv2252/BmrU family lipid kinase
MSEILVIINPAARSTRARDAWKRLGVLPANTTMAMTSAPGQARTLAAQAVADGYRIVVAVGGDGTINEVVNGIAGTDVALGVLPAGTMNVFAAELGLPSRLREAWRVIQAGHTRLIDLAAANRQYFVQLAGVGLDAQVVKETSWDLKRNLGPLSYLVSAAHVMSRKPPQIVAEADGRVLEGSFVLIGNGRFYGGPVAFFKEARIDDGLLDVLVFKNQSHLDIARYLGAILMGSHAALPDVEYFQTRKVVVRSDEAVPVEVDGELAAELPVTFRISSRKLRVVVPEGRR